MPPPTYKVVHFKKKLINNTVTAIYGPFTAGITELNPKLMPEQFAVYHN